MSARILAVFAVLASVVTGCAETDEDVATSEDTQHLSVAGDGMPSTPAPLDVPMPWDHDDVPTPPPSPRPTDDDLRDPLGPEGKCVLTYLKLYDPRGEPLEVPIVRCE